MTASLGPESAEGVPDTTGRNTGNWTVTFNPTTLGINLPVFECYHIVITGPPGSSFTIYIGSNFYDNVAQGDKNSWDPNQTMKLQQGQNVYFFWNTGAGTAPQVTMWFQEASPL
jgi:hypothetical protein